MRVLCPGCGARVPADDVELATLAAKCRACDEVFTVRGLGRAPRPTKRPPLPSALRVERGEPEVVGDGGYRASQTRGELVISRRWFTWAVLFTTPFCVVWLGFLAFWYVMVSETGAPWLFALFPIVHVIVGLALAYWTAAHWVNRTTIRVADGALEVRHGPVPWRGARTIPTDQLRQLYLRKRIHTRKNGMTRATWEVHAETADGAAAKLVSGLTERAQAVYMEWVIEQHLGIEDEPSMSHD